MRGVVKRRIPFEVCKRNILCLSDVSDMPLDQLTPHIRIGVPEPHSIFSAQRYYMSPDVSRVICNLICNGIKVYRFMTVIEQTMLTSAFCTRAHRHVSDKISAVAEDIGIAFDYCAYKLTCILSGRI